jgi:hypothetical protein
MLKLPGRDSVRVVGDRALRIVEPSGQVLDVSFDPATWYSPERSFLDYWRWSKGTAELTIHNPQSFSLMAEATFSMKSIDSRRVVLSTGGQPLWKGETDPTLRTAKVLGVRIPPGDTTWRFETDKPQAFPMGDPRGVGFSLRGFKLTVTGRAPAEPP